MAVGTTYDFNLNRDQIILNAYQKIGVLSERDESMPAVKLTKGIQALNMLVRQGDVYGEHLWALSTDTITLVADQFIYTTSDGLGSGNYQLLGAWYRASDGTDTQIEIYSRKGYEDVSDKLEVGVPKAVYLDDGYTLSSRSLYVIPSLTSVNSQSIVSGTDGNEYGCIKSHTSSSANQPITGENYKLYWTQVSGSEAAWASGTSYTAPEQIRLLVRRPIYDFDLQTDNPDFPQEWTRHLVYALAYDLSHDYGLSLDERKILKDEANLALGLVFPNRKNVTTIYNKHKDY